MLGNSSPGGLVLIHHYQIYTSERERRRQLPAEKLTKLPRALNGKPERGEPSQSGHLGNTLSKQPGARRLDRMKIESFVFGSLL